MFQILYSLHILHLHSISKLPLFWIFLSNPLISHTLLWIPSSVPVGQHWHSSYLLQFCGHSRNWKIGFGMAKNFIFFLNIINVASASYFSVLFALLVILLILHFCFVKYETDNQNFYWLGISWEGENGIGKRHITVKECWYLLPS